MKKTTLILLATILLACSGSDDGNESTTKKTNSELIIGKWKLTKQEEVFDEETIVTDFTNSDGETTHNYFEDGTLIFHEWGETFNLKYSISASNLNHLDDDVFIYKIILLDDDEMVLELPDNDDSPRVRYYDKLF